MNDYYTGECALCGAGIVETHDGQIHQGECIDDDDWPWYETDRGPFDFR